MTQTSAAMQAYFEDIDKQVKSLYALASKARAKGVDPEPKVATVLASTMAERVEGLVSIASPQIINSGVSEAIEKLEKEHGILSVKVALSIAGQVAQEKFCKFSSKKEAMEVGIRTGFAYHTVGVVAAPLEGFVELQIKKRKDGKEYLAPKFSGPIRGAGGTAIAVCLLIVDYIRVLFDYAPYDPSSEEIKRYITELEDYHDHVTNLQYNPSNKEIEFLIKHCPIEINGDPTEELEVSNYKDLPRMETNRIRGGVCLVVSMLALKAPKLFRLVSDFKAFGLDWMFLEDFLALQKEKKSGSEKSNKHLAPDYTFIADLVAGRPVLSFPLRSGGLRIRYGRTRLSGFSAMAIHPVTMQILGGYFATGTQLKTERPGKATAITPCDTIEGPVVLLEDGSVKQLSTKEEATACMKEIKEILYLGDVLISYGDFLDRAHPLVPVGYCEEWHILELKTQIEKQLGKCDNKTIATALSFPEEDIQNYFSQKPPSFSLASAFSRTFNIALHPHYTYYWKSITAQQLTSLYHWLGKHYKDAEKMVLPLSEEPKRALELLAVPHTVSQKEFVVIEKEHATSLVQCLDLKAYKEKTFSGENTLELVQSISKVLLRDKHGTPMGCRMGRPEKSKMRKMTGSPHVLFPVGEEGGKTRSFQTALEKKKITADFPRYLTKDGNESIYAFDEEGNQNTRLFTDSAGMVYKTTSRRPLDAVGFSRRAIPINDYYKQALRSLSLSQSPKLVKGVRGTSNDEHIPEYLPKGILRAKHQVTVNKDGTIRYDMSELPMTHFTAEEINVSVEQLRKLGYDKDYQGVALTSSSQTVELKPQDIVLPASEELVQENAENVLLNIAAFVDDELKNIYDLPAFYKYKNSKELIGTLVAGLAPHTSAAIVGRVIGFSKTQCFFAHPMFHAAMRRDADGDEACVVLLMDLFLNFSHQYLPSSRGARTMDAPIVLTSIIVASEVDDMVHKLDVSQHYSLDLYESSLTMKNPWDVKVELLSSRLGKPTQYEDLFFTHNTTNVNDGILRSSYKTLPSMQEKLKGQMELAEKIRAVDSSEVAKMVIDKHFIKDIKGNLRKFSTQQFRCSNCNTKFRRPPLKGNCLQCKGKIIFTVSEGSVVKYLQPAISLSERYITNSPYTQQTLLLTKNRIEEVFGIEKERQEGLGKWF